MRRMMARKRNAYSTAVHAKRERSFASLLRSTLQEGCHEEELEEILSFRSR